MPLYCPWSGIGTICEWEWYKEKNQMKEIKISTAKEIVESCKCDGVIIVGFDKTGRQHITTFGKSAADSKAAARIGNHINSWPNCNAQPIERVCHLCTFFKEGLRPCLVYGTCFCNVVPVNRRGEDIACHHFDHDYSQ